jgi:hypothetical protein
LPTFVAQAQPIEVWALRQQTRYRCVADGWGSDPVRWHRPFFSSAVPGHVYPAAPDHDALYRPHARDVPRGIVPKDDQIGVGPGTNDAEVVGAVQEPGSGARRRGDGLERREPALDEQLQLAPRRFAAGGVRHGGVAAHHDARTGERHATSERFHPREAFHHRRDLRGGRTLDRAPGAPLEHGERRIDPRSAHLQDAVQLLCLGTVEIGTGEHLVPAEPPRIVVGEHGLAVRLRLSPRHDARAE